MAGLVTVLIGRRGSGKTTMTKQMLDARQKNMPVMIYDINKEYQKYYNKKFVDWDVFLDEISDDERVRNTYILIEEATIFFDTSSRFQQMKKVLVQARHTGNIVHLNFHSWLAVPKNIFNMCNFVTVFKTQDTLMTVKAKYDREELLQAYQEAKNSSDEYFRKTVDLN